VLSGFLDPEASAIVSRGLEALQPPDPIHGAEPPRSRAQRFADALVLMAERSQGGTLPDSRPIAGVDIVVDHKILTRHPLVELDGLRCDIEGFGPIPRVTAERLGSSRPARAASCDGAGRVSAQTSTAARRSS